MRETLSSPTTREVAAKRVPLHFANGMALLLLSLFGILGNVLTTGQLWLYLVDALLIIAGFVSIFYGMLMQE